MRATSTLPVLFLFTVSAFGQERHGLLHSNYAGADAAWVNPARSAGQWPWLDIRFLGADVHAWNSLVAYSGRDQRLVGELRQGMSDGVVVMRSAGAGHAHRATVSIGVAGPGVSLALGRTTVGLGLRSRAHVSASGLSPAMGNFIFNGLNFEPQHGVRFSDEGVRVVGAAWTEFGVNLGRVLRAEGFGVLSAGINARYLQAHAGGALSFSGIDYTVLDTARASVHAATMSYGFAMPAAKAGGGFGADLGITYTRTDDEADGYMPHRSSGGCTPLRYNYRFGASLIDLGGLSFRDAQSGALQAGGLDIADYNDLPIDDEGDLDSLIASATRWTRSPGMRIGLPTGASVQFDKRIAGGAYLSAAVVQQLSARDGLRLRRANSIAFNARYEARQMEVALPLVIEEYDLRRPALGLMVRFNGIVVGTDRIGPLVSKRDMHAADFYFRLRWLINRSPFCKGKRNAKAPHAPGSGEALPCTQPNG
ncbi:MAG: hypothetical protein IPK70_06400 [Flavobacteriales bacterium]|jgi:hypothetical protein|nr:hypothetical protein [Flavobacteriales bacterium]